MINDNQYIIKDFEAWEKHGNALLKMIEMRGGIDRITQKELRITLSWYVWRILISRIS